MSMSRQHFEALAREIATIADLAARRAAAEAVARAAAQFNASFNKARFFKSCEVSDVI
jgi:hypothetical protein